jgi:glycosyltransferase involved in cell wall biosynthesis
LINIINDSGIVIENQGIQNSQGGTAAYIAGLIRFFRENGIQYCLTGNYTVSDPSQNVRVIRSTSNAGFIVRLFMYLSTHSQKRDEILYFQRPDHVFAGIFSKGKKILHLHGQPRTIIKNGRNPITWLIYNLLENIGMRFVHKVITTDRLAAELYVKHYPFLKARISIIPAGIDTAYFFPSAERPSIPGSVKPGTLVYIGRLGYPKRVDQVIRAFGIAKATDNSLKLVITGSGNDKSKLEHLADASGLSDSIVFTGELPKQEIRNLVQTADAAILLSYSEGSPISIKECLACGVPVIANEVGDVSEYVITGKTGAIVNPEALDEIATAIKNVISSDGSMKEACRQKSLDYDELKINKLILESMEK